MTSPTRSQLLDTLRFFRTQLNLRRYHRLAEEGNYLTQAILDAGLSWRRHLPEARRFAEDADRLLKGGLLIPFHRREDT